MAARSSDTEKRCCAPSVKELFYGSVTVGERGQIVVPAEARKHFGLEPGEKLLVFRQPHLPGLVLARLEDVQEMLQGMQAWVSVVRQIHQQAASETETPEQASEKDG